MFPSAKVSAASGADNKTGKCSLQTFKHQTVFRLASLILFLRFSLRCTANVSLNVSQVDTSVITMASQLHFDLCIQFSLQRGLKIQSGKLDRTRQLLYTQSVALSFDVGEYFKLEEMQVRLTGNSSFN